MNSKYNMCYSFAILFVHLHYPWIHLFSQQILTGFSLGTKDLLGARVAKMKKVLFLPSMTSCFIGKERHIKSFLESRYSRHICSIHVLPAHFQPTPSTYTRNPVREFVCIDLWISVFFPLRASFYVVEISETSNIMVYIYISLYKQKRKRYKKPKW